MIKSVDRKDRLKAFKKETILQAAKEVFAAKGLSGASIRSIASACGYTPGAIYSYFESKEHIYAEILAGVLDNLYDEMAQAIEHADVRGKAALVAIFKFYAARPDEYHLSYYLFEGMRRKGLTPELNSMLNDRLNRLADGLTNALDSLPSSNNSTAPSAIGISAMAHVSGVLLLHHTGRLKTFKQDGLSLVEHYYSLLARP
ncbi:MAG: TetR/AcrR family transcriptional regulator [Rhodospirillales bacterium]|nr:TetR/AcrR family transcriptional regulator [Rhodospirillales bacterium]